MRSTIGLLCVVMLCGCAQLDRMLGRNEPADLNMPQREQPEEMNRLAKFVGTWSDSAELQLRAAEKNEPGESASPEEPYTITNVSNMEYIWDGMVLKIEGTNQFPDGQSIGSTEYWTWDSAARCYRSTFVNAWGLSGSGTVRTDAEGKVYRFRGAGVNSKGKSYKYTGTMTWLDDDTVEWDVIEKTSRGRFHWKSTSRRKV